MKYHVLAVKDIAADCFAAPMFVLRLGAAMRGFGDEVAREAPENQLNKHPEHFQLWELGSYYDDDARFELLAVPRLLLSASDFQRNELRMRDSDGAVLSRLEQ